MREGPESHHPRAAAGRQSRPGLAGPRYDFKHPVVCVLRRYRDRYIYYGIIAIRFLKTKVSIC